MRFIKEDLKSNKSSFQPDTEAWWCLLSRPYISIDDLMLNFSISQEDSKELLTEAKANKLIKTPTDIYSITDVPKFFNTIQKYIDR